MLSERRDGSMDFIKNNKNKVIIGALSVLIIISLAVFLYISATTDKYAIKSSLFDNLTYSSEIVNNNFTGNTIIRDEQNNFKVSGKFEEGVFKDGLIYLKNGETEYFLDGTFDNFNLLNGTITIVTPDKHIEKTGEFKNNQLNGTGSIKITDVNTGEVLFSYAGNFSNDYPQY